MDEILVHDKMVVNFFGATDLFETIKPNNYVLADPAFFYLPEKLKNSIIDLFEKIETRTTRPMNMIIPSSAKGAYLLLTFCVKIVKWNLRRKLYNSRTEETTLKWLQFKHIIRV